MGRTLTHPLHQVLLFKTYWILMEKKPLIRKIHSFGPSEDLEDLDAPPTQIQLIFQELHLDIELEDQFFNWDTENIRKSFIELEYMLGGPPRVPKPDLLHERNRGSRKRFWADSVNDLMSYACMNEPVQNRVNLQRKRRKMTL